MKPRPHADVIKAWADGAEVEYQTGDGNWTLAIHPSFYTGYSYRVKKQSKWQDSLKQGPMICRVWLDGHAPKIKIVQIYSINVFGEDEFWLIESSEIYHNAEPLTKSEIKEFMDRAPE
jgi:hypothetical protein